jgi:transposase
MKDELWDTVARSKGFVSIRDAITKLYRDEKLSDEKVAERLDCSTPTVRAFRKRFDIEGRKVSHISVPKKYLKKLSCRELAEKFKISNATAWRLKKKHFPESHGE